MKVLVPYRGIYFLYPEQVRSAPSDCKGSRPLSGNLFSLHYRVDFYENGVERFSSPIGESIFSTGIISPVYVAQVSSRPLSGNLFSLQE